MSGDNKQNYNTTDFEKKFAVQDEDRIYSNFQFIPNAFKYIERIDVIIYNKNADYNKLVETIKQFGYISKKINFYNNRNDFNYQNNNFKNIDVNNNNQPQSFDFNKLLLLYEKIAKHEVKRPDWIKLTEAFNCSLIFCEHQKNGVSKNGLTGNNSIVLYSFIKNDKLLIKQLFDSRYMYVVNDHVSCHCMLSNHKYIVIINDRIFLNKAFDDVIDIYKD